MATRTPSGPFQVRPSVSSRRGRCHVEPGSLEPRASRHSRLPFTCTAPGLTISPDGGDRHGPRRALLSDSPVGASDPDAGRLEERGSLQGAGVGQLGARVPALLHTAAKQAAVTQAAHAARAGAGDAKSLTSAKVGAAPQEEEQLGGAVAGAAQQRGRGAGENAGGGARARSAEVSGAGGAGWHSRTPRQGVWEEAGRWGGGRVPASGRPEGTLDRVEDSIEEAGRDIQPIIKEGTDEVRRLRGPAPSPARGARTDRRCVAGAAACGAA